jgi:hypothetical protein
LWRILSRLSLELERQRESGWFVLKFNTC